MRARVAAFLCLVAVSDRGGPGPGAIHLPYPAAKQRAPAELDPSTDIVLVCHAGPMGDEIATIVAARGFLHVRNLAGGMKRWRGPVESGP